MSDSPLTAPPVPSAPPLPAIVPDVAPPPHPLDGKWFAHIGERTYGPYTGHQIKAYVAEGRMQAGSQVLPAGTETWTRAVDDPGLRPIFQEQMRVGPPPLTAAAGATVVQVTNQIGHPALAGLELAVSKSPGLAVVLSFFFCGLGQIYNGQIGKGILMLVGSVLLWVIFLGWIIWIWSMVDAYQTAKRMNLLYLRQMGGPLA